jgi:hypothetical protein
MKTVNLDQLFVDFLEEVLKESKLEMDTSVIKFCNAFIRNPLHITGKTVRNILKQEVEKLYGSASDVKQGLYIAFCEVFPGKIRRDDWPFFIEYKKAQLQSLMSVRVAVTLTSVIVPTSPKTSVFQLTVTGAFGRRQEVAHTPSEVRRFFEAVKLTCEVAGLQLPNFPAIPKES